MLSIALDLVVIVAASIANSGASTSPSDALSCSDQISEQLTISRAPRGVRRLSTHVLEVRSKRGPKRFVDKPPHDEGGLSGVHWRYCGYIPHAKMHLIGRADEGVFTGDLLADETGKVIRAGHSVLFSAQGNEFLSIEQESGVDGESWAVSETSGKTRWKGYAGVIGKVDGIEIVVSTFSQPQWKDNGVLVARYVCSTSKQSGEVLLIRTEAGMWKWTSHKNCA